MTLDSIVQDCEVLDTMTDVEKHRLRTTLSSLIFSNTLTKLYMLRDAHSISSAVTARIERCSESHAKRIYDNTSWIYEYFKSTRDEDKEEDKSSLYKVYLMNKHHGNVESLILDRENYKNNASLQSLRMRLDIDKKTNNGEMSEEERREALKELEEKLNTVDAEYGYVEYMEDVRNISKQIKDAILDKYYIDNPEITHPNVIKRKIVDGVEIITILTK